MRTVLRLLGTRYGIALVLVLIVLVIVTLGRTVLDDGSRRSPSYAPGSTVAAVPASADPFSSLGDDGVDESIAPAPSASSGAADAMMVATQFAKAWLRKPGITSEHWRDGLTPNASSELMASLADTDPADVPAATVTGAIQLQIKGITTVARVPTESGTIVLGLQIIGGRWQVTSLDWEAA